MRRGTGDPSRESRWRTQSGLPAAAVTARVRETITTTTTTIHYEDGSTEVVDGYPYPGYSSEEDLGLGSLEREERARARLWRIACHWYRIAENARAWKLAVGHAALIMQSQQDRLRWGRIATGAEVVSDADFRQRSYGTRWYAIGLGPNGGASQKGGGKARGRERGRRNW